MYAWLIAHNFGVVMMMAPMMLIAYAIVKIEDAIRAKLSKKN